MLSSSDEFDYLLDALKPLPEQAQGTHSATNVSGRDGERERDRDRDRERETERERQRESARETE